jgi:hypothetical protein
MQFVKRLTPLWVALLALLIIAGALYSYETIKLQGRVNVIAADGLGVYDAENMTEEITSLDFGTVKRGDTVIRDLWIANKTDKELVVSINATMDIWSSEPFRLLPGYYWKGQVWYDAPWSAEPGEKTFEIWIDAEEWRP